MYYDNTQAMALLTSRLPEIKNEKPGREIICTLANPQNTLTVSVETESLFHYLIGENDIPWELIPENYLISLINENEKKILLPDFSLTEYTLSVSGENHDPRPGAASVFTRHGIRFHLLGAEGHFDITPPLTVQGNDTAVICGIYRGFTQTHLGMIQMLREGDLFLLTHQQDSLRAGGHFQMTLEQTDEALQVTEISAVADETPETMPPQVRFDSQKLPVRVDFLRHRQVYPLGELLALRPGDRLTLPETGVNLITLEIGGQCFAQGELVRIGEQFAVEIHHCFHKDE